MASKNEWSPLDFVMPGVSSGLSFLGGLFGDSWEADAAHDQIQAQYDIAKANLQAQKDTNNTNMLNVLATNENQMQLQNQMNSFNKQMWDLNNKYNSPVEQMKRASAAGINPNVAIGSPVASSPVQQTTMANLQSPRIDAPLMSLNPIKGYSHTKLLEGIGKALEGLSRLPFIKEDLQAKKLANEKARLENEVLEYDKWNREEEKKMFNNFGMIRSTDGSGTFISPSEFYDLSEDERKRFLTPDYRHKISDKRISLSDFNNLSDEQKKMYEPDYTNKLPEIVKSPFKSREQFEGYKSLYSLGSTLSNIRADHLQNVLREKVYSGQLKHDSVTNAMIHMPDQQFQNLVYQMKSTIESVNRQRTENEGLKDRLKYNDDIARYTAEKMQRDSNRDVIKLLETYMPEGSLRNFFIGLYAVVKDIMASR